MIDVDWLDGDALFEVVRLAESGLPVILRRLPRAPGRHPRGDYQALIHTLQSRPNVVSKVVDARLPPLVAGDNLPPFWARRTDESLYLFFAHPMARELRYPMRYAQSLCRERVIRRVAIEFNGESSSHRLVFEPYQSILLRFSSRGDVRYLDLGYRPPEPTARCASEEPTTL